MLTFALDEERAIRCIMALEFSYKQGRDYPQDLYLARDLRHSFALDDGHVYHPDNPQEAM